MNKNHLQQEVRVDKNGVPVTRYVKTASSGQAKSALPAPRPVNAASYTSVIRVGELANKLDIDSTMPANRKFKMRNKLDSYSAETLGILEAVAEWNASRPSPEGQFMYFTIMQSTEEEVRAAAFCRPLFTVPVTSIEVRELTAGLPHLERYKSLHRVESLTGKELAIAAALLNVTAVAYPHGRTDDIEYTDSTTSTGLYLADPKVQFVVATHYQQADAIMRHIEERGAADPDAILEYLNNDTALADGIL